MLRDLRALEDELELLRTEEEMDEELDATNNLVGYAYIPEDEKRKKEQKQDIHRPDTKEAVRVDAVVCGVVGVLGMGFLSWIFYNWAVVRFALYGGMVCWAAYCVRQSVNAEAIAKENAKYNMRMESEAGSEERRE